MDKNQLYKKQSNEFKPFFPIVRLEDIIETIADKSIQWIINNYNHIYIEWENDVKGTRNRVPIILRRNGLWITYNNGQEVVTEIFIGDNRDISKLDYWLDDANWKRYDKVDFKDGDIEYQHLSDALKELLGQNKNITNFPDEEDLTVDGYTLKFKDKEYEPDNFSGLGRVILRKNIIGQKNILTQEMINKPNTIYEIRYDFDLNNEEITIPESCVLDFQGGSFNNGIIVGNKTTIKSTEVKIFHNIIFKWLNNESFINQKAIAEWFESIQDALNNYPNIVLSNRVYFVDKTLELNAFNTIDGNNATIKFIAKRSNNEPYKLIDFIDEKENISANIEILSPIVYEEMYSVKMGYCSNIKNLTITLNYGEGETNGVLIDPNYIKYSFEQFKFGEIDSYYTTVNPFLNNVTLESANISKQGSGSAISILTNKNYNVSGGMWGHLIHDIKILGTWYYGIVIDNGILIDDIPEFWITSSQFDNIIINTAKIGIFIGKQKGTLYHPGGLRFDNVKYQWSPDTHIGTIRSRRVAVIEDCNGVQFNTCLAIGWDDGRIYNNRPFLINPSLGTDITIQDCNTILHKTTKIFDVSNIPNNILINIKVIDNLHNHFFVLTDYLPLDVSIDNDRRAVVDKLKIIPVGIYSVDPLLHDVLGLNENFNITNKCFLEVFISNNRKIFKLFDSISSTDYKEKGLLISCILSLVYNGTVLLPEMWAYSPTFLEKKNPSYSKNNSKDFFISQVKNNLTYVADESTYIYRGYTITDEQRFSEVYFSGTILERPKLKALSTTRGFCFFDTDLGKPIYWEGNHWVDATGQKV